MGGPIQAVSRPDIDRGPETSEAEKAADVALRGIRAQNYSTEELQALRGAPNVLAQQGLIPEDIDRLITERDRELQEAKMTLGDGPLSRVAAQSIAVEQAQAVVGREAERVDRQIRGQAAQPQVSTIDRDQYRGLAVEAEELEKEAREYTQQRNRPPEPAPEITPEEKAYQEYEPQPPPGIRERAPQTAPAEMVEPDQLEESTYEEYTKLSPEERSYRLYEPEPPNREGEIREQIRGQATGTQVATIDNDQYQALAVEEEQFRKTGKFGEDVIEITQDDLRVDQAAPGVAHPGTQKLALKAGKPIKNITIRHPVTIAETGETVDVVEKADVALKRYNDQIEKYNQILGCIAK